MKIAFELQKLYQSMLNYTSDFHQRQTIKARNYIPVVLSVSQHVFSILKYTLSIFFSENGKLYS